MKRQILSVFLSIIVLSSCNNKANINSTNSDISESSESQSSQEIIELENLLEIHSIEMHNQYGDSTIIKYGDFDILVDGGSYDDATYVKNALDTYVTDNVLDLLIVSHPHSDHVGGIQNITTFESIYEITTIIDTGYVYGTAGGNYFKNVVNPFVANGSSHYSIKDVMVDESLSSFIIDENVSLTFLNTRYYEVADTTSNLNNTSIAFYIKYDNVILFMGGDIEKAAENSIMQLNEKFTTSDNVVIYKASHHGSKGANSENFLKYIEPDYCFASAASCVSANNEVNLSQHPYAEAIDRIAIHTQEIYWNGINGNLNIFTNGKEVTEINGEGRTINYKYDGEIVDPESEKDVTFLNSKWYLTGIEKNNWTDYGS